MISLICITHNPIIDNITTMLDSLPSIVDECILVNQNSTEKIPQEILDRFSKVFNTTKKGFGERDINYYCQFIKNNWILYLDDDEYLSESLSKRLPKLISKPNADVVMLQFDTFVDNVLIPEHIQGWERHPRLYRQGCVEWSEEGHTQPKFNPHRTFYPPKSLSVNHKRDLDKLIQSNKARESSLPKEMVTLQRQYVSRIIAYLKETVLIDGTNEFGIESLGKDKITPLKKTRSNKNANRIKKTD